MSEIVYIAGPVTTGGRNRKLNIEHMQKVVNQMAERGYIALSTALLPTGMSEDHYMRFGIEMLLSASIVVMLEGWTSSKGAAAEYHLARKLQKIVLYEKDIPTHI